MLFTLDMEAMLRQNGQVFTITRRTGMTMADGKPIHNHANFDITMLVHNTRKETWGQLTQGNSESNVVKARVPKTERMLMEGDIFRFNGDLYVVDYERAMQTNAADFRSFYCSMYKGVL